MRIGIIGAGLIGQERIKSLVKIQQKVAIEIVGFFDSSELVSEKVQYLTKLKSFKNINSLLKSKLDWVFVAVPHDLCLEICSLCLDHDVNVLVEKPLGRNITEANQLISKANMRNKRLNVGLNYRFFRGVANLIEDIHAQRFGDIISAKFSLGHGNSPGMENSWKLSPERCGGGCLIDPGVHIFDLINVCFPGDNKVISSAGWSGFWNTGIEEETHIILRGTNKQIILVDLSLNRWRSHFSIEINGVNGYGIVQGRGRSYGPQKYIIGQRWGWLQNKSQKDTEETIIDPYDADDSFFNETIRVLELEDHFDKQLTKQFPKAACAESAKDAMKLLEQCQNILIK